LVCFYVFWSALWSRSTPAFRWSNSSRAGLELAAAQGIQFAPDDGRRNPAMLQFEKVRSYARLCFCCSDCRPCLGRGPFYPRGTKEEGATSASVGEWHSDRAHTAPRPLLPWPDARISIRERKCRQAIPVVRITRFHPAATQASRIGSMGPTNTAWAAVHLHLGSAYRELTLRTVQQNKPRLRRRTCGQKAARAR
jgi:hypothetical protein